MISKANHYNIFLKLADKHGGCKERVIKNRNNN